VEQTASSGRLADDGQTTRDVDYYGGGGDPNRRILPRTGPAIVLPSRTDGSAISACVTWK
jgi:hypothetical protein